MLCCRDDEGSHRIPVDVGRRGHLDVAEALACSLKQAGRIWQLTAIVEAERDMLGCRRDPAEVLRQFLRASAIPDRLLLRPYNLKDLGQDGEEERPCMERKVANTGWIAGHYLTELREAGSGGFCFRHVWYLAPLLPTGQAHPCPFSYPPDPLKPQRSDKLGLRGQVKKFGNIDDTISY